MWPRWGWTLYSLTMLAVRPHGFFARLGRLDWYGGLLRVWADGLGLTPDSRVLEVGCSAGTLSHALARHGHRVVGIDRSARAIRLAQTTHGSGTTVSVFLQGDATNLPFAKGSFDVTLAASLLNLVPEPERIVAEMARVTSPGGIVSHLFPTPEMNATAARRYIKQHALTGFSAEALALWAALAHKLDPGKAVRLLEAERVTNIWIVHYLEGMVCAVTGRKPVD